MVRGKGCIEKNLNIVVVFPGNMAFKQQSQKGIYFCSCCCACC